MGKIVKVIKNIYGKVDWEIVRAILYKLLKQKIIIKENNSIIKIDRKFIREYVYSQYSVLAMRKIKNVKANLSYYIKEIVENSGHVLGEQNIKSKHKKDASLGFEKYKSMFVIEDKNGKKEKFSCTIVVRCPNYKEKFLYDIVDIKKASPPQ